MKNKDIFLAVRINALTRDGSQIRRKKQLLQAYAAKSVSMKGFQDLCRSIDVLKSENHTREISYNKVLSSPIYATCTGNHISQ